MDNKGLTITMIFLAESANYGEGIGNITTLKKMTRGKELWKGIKLRESAGMIRRLRGHGWRRV